MTSEFLSSFFRDNPLHSSGPAVIEAVSGAMLGAAGNTGGKPRMVGGLPG